MRRFHHVLAKRRARRNRGGDIVLEMRGGDIVLEMTGGDIVLEMTGGYRA
jgi:hypothetical protein